MKTSWKIQKDYGAISAHEISVDWGEFNFLVIYGHHINGWFCAIPNWSICVEQSTPDSVPYNADKLAAGLKDASMGEAVAEAICKHYDAVGRNAENNSAGIKIND